MTSRFSSAVPLILLTLLAAVSFWLERSIGTPTATQGKSRHDADFWVENFVVKQFAASGELRHTLHAERMTHYPDDDTTVIYLPRLRYHQQPPLDLTAMVGLVGPKGDEVRLSNEVTLTRDGVRDKQPLRIITRELTVFPREQRAYSNQPVTIVQGRSQIRGSGVELDHKVGTTVLRGPVRATLEPRGKS